MPTLQEVLEDMPDAAVIDDGADNWDAENLLDALANSDWLNRKVSE